MPDQVHIVIGEAGAAELRQALRELGRDDRVLEFPDDLSFGPIAPPDPAIRAAWIADTLHEDDWHEIVPHVEKFWADVLSAGEHHVVWFSRRVTRDYAGFLEYLWRIGDRPCDVVDITEASVPVRGVDSSITRRRRALALGLLDSYQFIDGNLFSHAVPLGEKARAAYHDEWTKLRDENAPLRIVTPELSLVSVPLTHFDEMLLSGMQTRFLKSARIIGQVMSRAWDSEIYDVDDFFLSSRLIALVKAGLIESQDNLRRMRYSEVRLPPVPAKS